MERSPSRAVRSALPSAVKVIALFPLCWFLCGSWLLAQEKSPRPTFQPGFEYVLRNHQRLETVLGAGLPNAGKQVAEVEIDLASSCRAGGLSGQREIAIRLARVRVNLAMGEISMSYDSSQADSAETLLGQTFKGVIGKSFLVVLDSQDQVIEVRGQEAFAVPKSPLGQYVGVDQLIQVAMPMVALGVPDGGVLPGQSWDHVKNNSMGPAGKLRATYHVTRNGREQGLAAYSYRARLELDPAAAPAGADPKVRIGIEDGGLTGSMRVDEGKNFPVSGSAEGSLVMTMPNPADPNQALRLPISQKRSFELLSMKPLE